MRFNFWGVYILQICNFRIFFAYLNSRLLGTVVLKHSWMKYSQIYGVSPYTIIVYGSCRSAKLAGLIVGFVWRCHCIEWRAASEDFKYTRWYGCFSLEKDLVAPAKEATEKICSLLQWIEALKRSVMYHARSRLYALPAAGWVHILWSYREQRTECRLIAILVSHDVSIGLSCVRVHLQ